MLPEELGIGVLAAKLEGSNVDTLQAFLETLE